MTKLFETLETAHEELDVLRTQLTGMFVSHQSFLPLAHLLLLLCLQESDDRLSLSRVFGHLINDVGPMIDRVATGCRVLHGELGDGRTLEGCTFRVALADQRELVELVGDEIDITEEGVLDVGNG